MKKIISILLLVCTLSLCFISCEKNEENETEGTENFTAEELITEEFIISELSDSDGKLGGTLTITSGTSDNVLAFNYVVTGINAGKLMDKSFTKNAAQKMLSNPGSITYEEYKVCTAFAAASGVFNIFYEDESIHNYDYFIDEILSIICDRSAKTYGNWTISASVDQTSDSIAIAAVRN